MIGMNATTIPTAIPTIPITTIRPDGPFSLRESAMFGFGQRHQTAFDGTMRFAFCLDDGSGHGAATVVQRDDEVDIAVHAGPPNAVVTQVCRVLSLAADHPTDEYSGVADRDPVIAELQQLRPGLRPPLFHSPYEAAAWCIISARRPGRQMAVVRDRLSAAHGASFELSGETLVAFPTPRELRRVDAFPGLDGLKVARLHAVAEAADAGLLDVDRLRRLGPDEAAREVQQLPGIGPLYSALIAVRAVGFTDALATNEPRLLEAVGRRYGLVRPATAVELERLAEAWRPFRTWASVLIRATAAM
ncbi:MAG: 3-methyladenine glycosylase/8-oxoguanine glycosylase-like protein [Ilumatobacteraceae bacterium]|nr:3-methyladenine glycosylase/8-oxoguanine glycosylase-like protein [Ilumatobacteraceae bacterium]